MHVYLHQERRLINPLAEDCKRNLVCKRTILAQAAWKMLLSTCNTMPLINGSNRIVRIEPVVRSLAFKLDWEDWYGLRAAARGEQRP